MAAREQHRNFQIRENQAGLEECGTCCKDPGDVPGLQKWEWDGLWDKEIEIMGGKKLVTAWGLSFHPFSRGQA